LISLAFMSILRSCEWPAEGALESALAVTASSAEARMANLRSTT
jgi:hypothetical protein